MNDETVAVVVAAVVGALLREFACVLERRRRRAGERRTRETDRPLGDRQQPPQTHSNGL